MSDEDVPLVPLKPDKDQRTLFSLAKVVRMDNMSMCFTLEEINTMREELLVASATKHELLIILRKLDCYKLQVEDLRSTGIGAAVATLAAHHPRPAVVRLASSLLQKWRDLVETSLFAAAPEYDVAAAAAAEEGEAVAPEDLIAAEKEAARLEKLERRRQRIEEDFMAVSSSDEEMSDAGEDPEWEPQAKANKRAEKVAAWGALFNGRRSRSGRLAAAATASERNASQATQKTDDSSGAEAPPQERSPNENAGAVAVAVAVAGDGAGDAPPPAKKVAKARPTILAMLQRGAQAQAQAAAAAAVEAAPAPAEAAKTEAPAPVEAPVPPPPEVAAS